MYCGWGVGGRRGGRGLLGGRGGNNKEGTKGQNYEKKKYKDKWRITHKIKSDGFRTKIKIKGISRVNNQRIYWINMKKKLLIFSCLVEKPLIEETKKNFHQKQKDKKREQIG